MTAHRDEILAALRADDPFPAIHAVSKRLVSEGVDRQALISEMENLRAHVADGQEDALLEVMDCLAGFSSPHMRI
jgi:hypothetical protein